MIMLFCCLLSLSGVTFIGIDLLVEIAKLDNAEIREKELNTGNIGREDWQFNEILLIRID